MAYGTTTRAMLIDSVSVEFGVSKNDATRLVDFIFSRISQDLSRNGSVNITNFGTFSVKKHKGHLVQSGHKQVGSTDGSAEYRRIDDYNVVRFTPSVYLKDRVNASLNDSQEGMKIRGSIQGMSRGKQDGLGRGRPKKVLTEEEQMKRALALRMIQEDMASGIAVTTKSVAEKVDMPVYVVTKWRNEANLSVKDVKKHLASR